MCDFLVEICIMKAKTKKKLHNVLYSFSKELLAGLEPATC